VNASEKTDPLILAIETATRAGSVAVSRGQKVFACREGDASVSHSANLIEMIELVLQKAGATLSEIDLFAAAVGPGSFTGLRIGLATVKAFSAVTGHDVIGVSTLAALAHANGPVEFTVALLPAGRGEVFAQMFQVDNDDVVPLDEAAHLTPKETLQRYKDGTGVRWAGEGVVKVDEYLATLGMPALNGIPLKAEGPPEGGSLNQTPECLAASVAALAFRDYREGKSVGAEELHAVYVRPSDAEINQRWLQQNLQKSVPN
jgi:tRNA threonylcarbamoyladenosine biosynthesis protein TsaB